MSLTVDGLASGLRHIAVTLLILAGSVLVAHAHQVNLSTVSYTHLTLPTNREV